MKFKNTEINEARSSLKHIKAGKIEKKKPKIVKKILNNNVKKTGDDADGANKPKDINNKSKNDLSDVKNNHEIKHKLQDEAPFEKKSKAELKKIEKKKAKKQANKLKKQLKKAQDKNFEKATAAVQISEQKDECSTEKALRGVNGDPHKKHISFVNGKQKSQDFKTVENKNVDASSPELLTKKEKKAMRRRLIEDQKLKTSGQVLIKEGTSSSTNINATSNNTLTKKGKKAMSGKLMEDKHLETSDSKNIDATSNKVLTKKENKALKRQLKKDEKHSEKSTRDPAVEEATVFVGNLPVNTKRVQLLKLFKKVGPVNCIRLRTAGGQILHKHKQRKLAGSLNAYVVLQSKENAEKALSLNGFEFKSNHLRVTLATKKPESQDNSEAKRTVFIGNLKYSASEESLREIFSSCGEIDYVRCIRDGDKGCKGVAYVCFKNADAVGLTLELNETMVDERAIHVERYNVKKLGANKAREAEAEKEHKSKKGAKLRLESKKSKQENSGHKFENRVKVDKKSKKSEFRGVKVDGLKKKQKSKKKSNNQMLLLAKRIAPKPKN